MADAIAITQTPKCKVLVQQVGTDLVMRPQGEINEDLNFGGIMKTLKELLANTKGLVFDMRQVQKINSCGVREWLMFMQNVQAVIPCRFLAVNETFIEQASIVPTLLGRKGTQIEAFEAPYFCSNCNERSLTLLKTASLKLDSGTFTAPAVNC